MTHKIGTFGPRLQAFMIGGYTRIRHESPRPPFPVADMLFRIHTL
jgi:hypothetical protein